MGVEAAGQASIPRPVEGSAGGCHKESLGTWGRERRSSDVAQPTEVTRERDVMYPPWEGSICFPTWPLNFFIFVLCHQSQNTHSVLTSEAAAGFMRRGRCDCADTPLYTQARLIRCCLIVGELKICLRYRMNWLIVWYLTCVWTVFNSRRKRVVFYHPW